MAYLDKGFKAIGTLVGEALIACVGLGTVYGIGFFTGFKKGSGAEELIDEIKNKIKEETEPEEIEPEETQDTDEDEDVIVDEADPDLLRQAMEMTNNQPED